MKKSRRKRTQVERLANDIFSPNGDFCYGGKNCSHKKFFHLMPEYCTHIYPETMINISLHLHMQKREQEKESNGN